MKDPLKKTSVSLSFSAKLCRSKWYFRTFVRHQSGNMISLDVTWCLLFIFTFQLTHFSIKAWNRTLRLLPHFFFYPYLTSLPNPFLSIQLFPPYPISTQPYPKIPTALRRNTSFLCPPLPPRPFQWWCQRGESKKWKSWFSFFLSVVVGRTKRWGTSLWWEVWQEVFFNVDVLVLVYERAQLLVCSAEKTVKPLV